MKRSGYSGYGNSKRSRGQSNSRVLMGRYRAALTARRRFVRRPRTATFSRRGTAYAFRNIRTGGFGGIELKYKDYAFGPTAFNGTANMSVGMMDPLGPLCLNGLNEGSNQSQRIGVKVTNKVLSIQGVVTWKPKLAATTVPDLFPCVMYIVLDTQTNSAQAVSTNIFTNESGNTIGVTSAFRNIEFATRFRVLKKVIIQPPQIGIAVKAADVVISQGWSKNFSIYMSLRNMVTTYNTGDNGDVTDIIDNSLHMVGYSPTSATAVCELLYNSRVRYEG